MKRKPWILLSALALVAVLAGATFAEDGEDKKDIAKMSAKDLYKNACKPCHTEDAEAGEYTPMSLIGDQWEEFFDEDLVETHKDLPCPGNKDAKLLETLDKDLIKKLRNFCVDHAADSEQPMTCG